MIRKVVMVRTDNDDRDLTLSALKESEHEFEIDFVSNLEELEINVKAAGEPALILLNDNDAARKAYELVRQLKNQSPYNHIPIVVLGEKSTREYIRKCYEAGANSFITKPSTISDTNLKISKFFDYWLQVADL